MGVCDMRREGFEGGGGGGREKRECARTNVEKTGIFEETSEETGCRKTGGKNWYRRSVKKPMRKKNRYENPIENSLDSPIYAAVSLTPLVNSVSLSLASAARTENCPPAPHHTSFSSLTAELSSSVASVISSVVPCPV